MAVGVTEKVPFSIRMVQPRVPLIRNGTMRLKVIATRAEARCYKYHSDLCFMAN